MATETCQHCHDLTWHASLDFTDDVTNFGVHGIYSYPARFVPQIPRHFIHKYNPSVVLDPFSGSGTTIVEAKLHESHGIAMDIMPIALACAKVKTWEFDAMSFHRNAVVMEIMMDEPKKKPLPAILQDAISFSGDVEYVFPLDVQEQIQAVRTAIESVPNGTAKLFFKLCAAQELRRCSKAKPGELDWSPRREGETETNYIGCFRDKYRKEAKNFEVFQRDFPSFRNNVQPTIINTQREWLHESCDLIVTSPPYGKLVTVINYPDIHKYAHALFFDKESLPSNKQFIQTTAQLNLYFQRVIPFLRKGKHVVVVVAPSNSDNWVAETRNILKACGCEKCDEIERVIDPKKKFIPGNIKKEWVLDWVKA